MRSTAAKLLLVLALLAALAALCGGWKWNTNTSGITTRSAYGWTWDGLSSIHRDGWTWDGGAADRSSA